ncbi:MAG: 50S ribosomal protein L23 [Patescibacteria group bacterium]
MALFAKNSNKAATASYKTVQRAPETTLLPVMSEKAVRLQKLGQYMLAVKPGVSKIQVKKVIEAAYGVRVVGVNSAKLPRKNVRRGRTTGQTKVRRHMIVRLAAGQSIELSKTV